MPNRVVLTTAAKAGDKFESRSLGSTDPISVAAAELQFWFREALSSFYK